LIGNREKLEGDGWSLKKEMKTKKKIAEPSAIAVLTSYIPT
jgi:hypothetical protein